MRNSLKSLTALAFLLMMLGFSSCFDIYEEYQFNADGSGKARIEMDISKMYGLLEGMGSALDSTGDGGSMEEMDAMFTDSKDIDAIKGIPGISNVTNISNAETKMVGLTFEFANIEALNTALAARGNDMGMGMGAAMGLASENGAETEKDNSIQFDGKRLRRTLDMKMDEPSEDDDEETEQAAAMAKMMFKDAKYTIKYVFPRSVKKVKGNDAAVVGADKKSVTVENSLSDLLEGKASMTTDIRLK